MGQAGSTEKICILCGLDCSDRPRVKDAQGRYACKTCVEPSPSFRTRTQPPQPSPTSDDAGFALEPVQPPASPKPPRRPDTFAGQRCEHCGYALTGLTVPRCPECGKAVETDVRRRWDRETSRSIARQTYLTPTLMILIGSTIVVSLLTWMHGIELAGFYLIYTLVFSVPVGLGVFVGCALLWIGLDAPLHLTALRLAGIYFVVDIVRIVLGSLPIHFIPLAGLFIWIIPLLVYTYLLAEQMELEYQDALIVAIVTGFIKFVALMLLSRYLDVAVL